MEDVVSPPQSAWRWYQGETRPDHSGGPKIAPVRTLEHHRNVDQDLTGAPVDSGWQINPGAANVAASGCGQRSGRCDRGSDSRRVVRDSVPYGAIVLDVAP